MAFPTGGSPYKPRSAKPKKPTASKWGPAVQSQTNTVKGNAREGQAYTVEKRKGGTVHVYDDGRRVFVRKRRQAANKSQGRGDI